MINTLIKTAMKMDGTQETRVRKAMTLYKQARALLTKQRTLIDPLLGQVSCLDREMFEGLPGPATYEGIDHDKGYVRASKNIKGINFAHLYEAGEITKLLQQGRL